MAGPRGLLRALLLIALGAAASAWILLQVDSSVAPGPTSGGDTAAATDTGPKPDGARPAEAFESLEQTLARLQRLRAPAVPGDALPPGWPGPVGAARPRADAFRPDLPGAGPTFP